MPIPGDNGNPKEERNAQNKRIEEVGLKGGLVQKDVKVVNVPKPDKCIFGVLHK